MMFAICHINPPGFLFFLEEEKKIDRSREWDVREGREKGLNKGREVGMLRIKEKGGMECNNFPNEYKPYIIYINAIYYHYCIYYLEDFHMNIKVV